MVDALDRHDAAVRQWFAEAHAAGFLSDAQRDVLAAVERRTPADLFARAAGRPLVVAFFGGTGVGKSSLLNRIAGRDIARAGVERPTSRELTLYLHQDVELADLPAELPLADIRVNRHDDPDRRDLLWVDAPDVDSTVASNRRAVLAWLPHIDLIVYVVSPERYRDDAGWRILLNRRGRHGWMFVLNRWDEGRLPQRDDLAQILRSAGFEDPALFCTCCGPVARRAALPSPDEFEHLEHTLRTAMDAHGRAELERLGLRSRLIDLRAAIETAARAVGPAEAWRAARERCTEDWGQVNAALLEGLQWPVRSAAARLAARFGAHAWNTVHGAMGLLREWRPSPAGVAAPADRAAIATSDSAGPAPAELLHVTRDLWDDWARSKLRSAMESIESRLHAERLPAAASRPDVERVLSAAPEALAAEIHDRLRAALSNPGGRLNRAARRVTGFLMTALPFLAGAWIAFHVVNGFREATLLGAPFLGSDFAIHSAMLLAVSWAVPFALDRMLRPSLERAIRRACCEALEVGLARLGRDVGRCLDATARRAQEFRESAAAIAQDIARSACPPPAPVNPGVGRLLANVEPTR